VDQTHVHFDQPALEATLADYLEEVDHVAARIGKLEKATGEAVRQAPGRDPDGYRSATSSARRCANHCRHDRLRARTLSRFQRPRQLMGYSGLVAREHSSGNRVQRRGIAKTGNVHLRRALVEAVWAYQHRPNVTGFLLRKQKNLALSDAVKKIAWKAQQRLHKRYKDLRPAAKTRIRL
jgi:transposase